MRCGGAGQEQAGQEQAGHEQAGHEQAGQDEVGQEQARHEQEGPVLAAVRGPGGGTAGSPGRDGTAGRGPSSSFIPTWRATSRK